MPPDAVNSPPIVASAEVVRLFRDTVPENVAPPDTEIPWNNGTATTSTTRTAVVPLTTTLPEGPALTVATASP